jgi:predicted nuclease of restriction endonuclease-like (RecB) superfamily
MTKTLKIAKRTRPATTGTTVGESSFYRDIAELLSKGRQIAVRAVNSAMVTTYWQIGRRIVEQEQKGKERADYGWYLIENLSRYLGNTLGKGFSVANLRNMRQFYLTFPDMDENARRCLANLSWSHVCLIMRLGNRQEREWYLLETACENWTVRALERNIRTRYYHRLLSTQKGKPAHRRDDKPEPDEIIKDPMVLEFLGLPEDTQGKESLVERALLGHLQKFLLELGKGFSFVARQMRISTETEHFYLDLVFYNYLLKCFVIVDLKTARLTHQDIGQMDMYVRMFDAVKRVDGDNPTIGIILCAEKSKVVAKYSILNDSKQIFAAKYMTVLPTEEQLKCELENERRLLAERYDDAEIETELSASAPKAPAKKGKRNG